MRSTKKFSNRPRTSRSIKRLNSLIDNGDPSKSSIRTGGRKTIKPMPEKKKLSELQEEILEEAPCPDNDSLMNAIRKAGDRAMERVKESLRDDSRRTRIEEE